jgi:hypothetical protein
MEWAENLYLFGTPAVAAGAVWGVFKLLKNSAPLKSAVLNTLTNPTRPPTELLREQYSIVRGIVIGSKHFCLKRILLAVAVTGLWILALAALRLLAPQTFFGFVAVQYFVFAYDHPMIYAALVLLTITMLLIVVEVFDLLLTWTLFRQRSLAVNALWLCIAYVASLLAAAFLIGICTEAYFIIANAPDEKSALSIRHIPEIVVSAISRVIIFVAHPWELPFLLVQGLQWSLQPFSMDDVAGFVIFQGINYAVTLLSYLALLPMLMLSIFALTTLNVAFFLGLLVVRIDLLLRVKYGYDQKKILEEPVEYLGRVASCVAFIVVLVINASVLLFNQTTPRPSDEKISFFAPDLSY